MSSLIDLGEPDSLWRATARHPAVAHPELAGDERADVAVIGGGYAGLSTALHLAEHGIDVALLEAHRIGFGASGRNGGQVNPGLKLGRAELETRFGAEGARLHALGEDAPDFLAALVRRKGLDCGFRRPGVLRLAHSPKAMKVAEGAVEDLARRGVKARLLDRSETASLVGGDLYLGGVLDPRGGSLHPLEYCHELGRVAKDAKVRIFERSPAQVAHRRNGRWTVATPAGQLVVGTVVVATNGYTGPLVKSLARSVLPVNSFQIATPRLTDNIAGHILPGGHAAFDSRRLILYFRKMEDGRIVLGGRASFSSRLGVGSGAPDYSVLERTLHEILPSTRDAGIEKRWTGLVCITPDFIPHCHEPEPSLNVLLGFNGRGVAAATRAGAWLADRIADEDNGDAAIPQTKIRAIPFHGLRAPALDIAMRWGLLMDRIGR